MKEGLVILFTDYFFNLYHGVPWGVYSVLIFVCCFGFLLIGFNNGVKKGLRAFFRLLLIEYIVLLFCSTAFFREINEIQKFEFRPFWSYLAIYEGKEELLPEIIMNVVVFIPVGFLLGCISGKTRLRKVVLIGCGLSVLIEVLQFVFKLGLCEFDDVFHNTLWCLIGFGTYFLVRSKYRKFSSKRMSVL